MSSDYLQIITTQRRLDVQKAKTSVSPDTIKTMALTTEFDIVNFVSRLQSGPGVSVMAEIKRASPSKGDLAPGMNASHQGLRYALAGASVISCLTEPKWFKGTLEDLQSVRRVLQTVPNRPALLRKDFIIDEYQIYEARVYGADSVLLIVATLTDDELVHLMATSRKLHMEPLVEVANELEMNRALTLGAKVIGINNRDLHTFKVNLNTTAQLLETARKDANTIFAALSGITSRDDVKYFELVGVKAILVGEALMKASNPMNKIKELVGQRFPFVKICGLKDVNKAIQTAEFGADFIGLVFAKGSPRTITLQQGQEIVNALRVWRGDKTIADGLNAQPRKETLEWYTDSTQLLSHKLTKTSPLIVGVFADDDADTINSISSQVGLDLIQLSGNEDVSLISKLNRPCWKAIHVDQNSQLLDQCKLWCGYAAAILLDTRDPNAKGGTGKAFDWGIATQLSDTSGLPFILAGGLDPDNISAAVKQVSPFAVDVSSGVETDKVKDLNKIRRFITNAKSSQ